MHGHCGGLKAARQPVGLKEPLINIGILVMAWERGVVSCPRLRRWGAIGAEESSHITSRHSLCWILKRGMKAIRHDDD